MKVYLDLTIFVVSLSFIIVSLILFDSIIRLLFFSLFIYYSILNIQNNFNNETFY